MVQGVRVGRRPVCRGRGMCQRQRGRQHGERRRRRLRDRRVRLRRGRRGRGDQPRGSPGDQRRRRDAGSGPGERARARAGPPGREVRPEGRHAARSPGEAHDRGRAVLRGRRADGRNGPRGRRFDRGGHRDELLERGARGGGQAPRGQGHPVDVGIEHQPGPHGPGAAQPVLRPDRAQRPHPGRDRRRVLARRGSSGRRRQPRSPTRVPTPRASWVPSRRTSKPAAER